ncbi:MAG: hypothetical protein PHV74_13510 [Dehalococcoidia bacterium]|nr:hypothetical protein [Dehalococcoidia bacterium]
MLDWQAIGRDAAKPWVELATLEDFEKLFHDVAIHRKNGENVTGLLSDYIKPGTMRFEDYLNEHDQWFSRQAKLDQTSNLYDWARSEFYQGWLSYLTAVWQMLNDRLTDIVHDEFSDAFRDG